MGTLSDVEAALNGMSTPSPRAHEAIKRDFVREVEWHADGCGRVGTPILRERRSSLASARDQFKVSVGAPIRSSEFRLAQLRKLDAISMSPLVNRESPQGYRLGVQY